MKILAAAILVLLAIPAHAADYRDCREFYVYPTASVIAPAKPDKRPWDNDSGPDVQVYAKPAGRSDLRFTSISRKAQDAKSIIGWSPVWPAESEGGVWLPIRIGDSLSLSMVDRDVLSDDSIGAASFEIPKNLASVGLAFSR